jgi:NadR type nicotinamide-nucleotide adenylyltransferase
MCFKVVIIGPESTGKSTLAQGLSAYFDCLWVPEYARRYLEEKKENYEYSDLLAIAKGQIDLEDKLAQSAKELLICDTNLHVIQVWSDHKFGTSDPWILDQIQKRRYDFYLLTDIDIPWEDDPQREHPQPEMRKYFMEKYRELVSATGVPFAVISGNQEQRLESAIAEIEKAKSDDK